MSTFASSVFSTEPDSEDAGQIVGQALREAFSEHELKAAFVYSTVNHEQELLLSAIREEIGSSALLLGCSAQGVVCNDEVTEEGLAVGVLGLGGSELNVVAAVEHEIGTGSQEKGQTLAQRLVAELGHEPKLVVLLYDPLCGADVEALLSGLHRELSCPCVGAGAGQPWGPPVATYQYWNEQVLSKSVVALALDGSFSFELGLCHGTVPTGLSMTITKAEGNSILEIDGRCALDVWREHTGFTEGTTVHQEQLAAWAIGIERRIPAPGGDGATEQVAQMIRGVFALDFEAGAVVLQTAIPEGSNVTFHHRTIDRVLEGTKEMGNGLAQELSGKAPWAVLGFECAARTFPFLGNANTVDEHHTLRPAIAPEAPWLGMMAWGEIAPLGGQPAFHNYTYSVVVLTR